MSLPYPQIDPVLVQIGPVAIRWYALAYIAGIVIGWRYLIELMRRPALWAPKGASAQGSFGPPLSKDQLDDLVSWVTLGIILGGRLGYVFFYDPALLAAPWVSVASMLGGEGLLAKVIGWVHIPPALMIWRGGMSFHGGLIGVTLAGWLFARRNNLDALRIGDLFAFAAPIGLFFGRIANFINAELYGRETDAPWGMVFPTDPTGLVRHPSQLYEAFLEGLVLFAALVIAMRRFGLLARPGAAIGVFLAGYGIARSLVETVREPDPHMPDFPLGVTMGMILSMPMIALGVWLVRRAYNRPAVGGPSGGAPAAAASLSAKTDAKAA